MCTIPTEGAASLRFLQEPALSLSKGCAAMLGQRPKTGDRRQKLEKLGKNWGQTGRSPISIRRKNWGTFRLSPVLFGFIRSFVPTSVVS
jgi:hypothetical protein